MPKILFLFVTIFFISSKLFAQDFTQQSDLPIEITSDNLEVLQKDQEAIFSGSVQAIQGNVNIHANKMHVYYTAKKNKIGDTQNAVSKVETTGNVKLITPKEKAQSDKGIFDVKKNTITLLGNVSLTVGKNVVKGEKFVYNVKTGKSNIVGNNNPNNGSKKKERVRGVFMPSG